MCSARREEAEPRRTRTAFFKRHLTLKRQAGWWGGDFGMRQDRHGGHGVAGVLGG